MTVKHTPGPWRVRTKKDGAEVKAIATVAWCGVGAAYSPVSGVTQHIDADECAANARLIAAAPDLLVALNRSTGLLERELSALDENATCGRETLQEQIANNYAVMAAAKGE